MESVSRPRPCLSCVFGALACVAAVWASFAWLDLPFNELFAASALTDMGRFIGAFFPPDLSSAFLAKVAGGTLETLAISAIGTVLAVVAAVFLALPAAGRFGLPARAGARLVLNFLRSVPELVWATLMVLLAGLGPFAGVLALALHTAGVLGRLFAEALENSSAEPEAALRELGAGPVSAFCYGVMPLVGAQWLAYALYRWEMNIRMAAILGFVGAGGLGTILYYELSLFHEARASTVIIAMLGLSVLVDTVSALFRRGRLAAQ